MTAAPGRWLRDPNWTAAGRPVRAGTIVLGFCGLAALAVQVVSLAVPASRDWSTSVAWALAAAVAAIGTLTAELRVHVRRVTRESWILWGAGAGCWAVGIVLAAVLGPGHGLPADVWFLALPLLGVFTYFRRVPRAFLFVLFLLDAIPVVLLIVALTLDLGRIHDGVVYTAVFTGLYVLLAANAIQMIGLHRNLRARENGIELVLSAAPLPALSCDPERIAQVLDNLVTNAIKFTPPGGRVAVTLRPAAGGVSIEVSDTGMGISGPDQQRIFDTFFRSESAVRRAIPGTGLGLAITKAIVDAHHGSIAVDSREGAGTTFRVWLPRQQAAPGQAGGGRPRTAAAHQLAR